MITIKTESPESPHSILERKRVIDSQNLFGHDREILIQHGNQIYQLKITRQDKLILTK